jgi:hypothetical protein
MRTSSNGTDNPTAKTSLRSPSSIELKCYATQKSKKAKPAQVTKNITTPTLVRVLPFKLGIAGKRKISFQRPETIKPAAGFTLPFPLYLAATVDGYPNPTCLWVMTCLHFFGRFMGINAGLTLLDFLPRQKGMMSQLDRN